MNLLHQKQWIAQQSIIPLTLFPLVVGIMMVDKVFDLSIDDAFADNDVGTIAN